MPSIKKRETFYLAGYDPRGARHYYNLYKKESNNSLKISTRKKTDTYKHTWHIKNNQTKTTYHYLVWDDIIRSNWTKGFFSLLLELFYYLRVYFLTGLVIKFARLSVRQLKPAFFPIVYMCLTLYLVYLLLYYVSSYAEPYIGIYLALLLAIVSAYFLVKLSTTLGNKIAVFWLLRIYVFSAKYVKTPMPTLEKRLDTFAGYITKSIYEAKEKNTDEILIVAHSVGSILIIPVLARVFKEEGLDRSVLDKVSILTLGECIPLVSFLPDAHDYKEEMLAVAKEKHFWLDMTAPIDEACFPLLDYYKHSGVDVEEGEGPVFKSPRFHTLYDAKTYKDIKKDVHITHFVYLMATQEKGLYDYFEITSGDKNLHERFKETLV